MIGSLRIGAQVAYSSNTQEIKKTGSEIKNRYWTLMPNVKWNWLNLKIVSFYTRVGAGASFSKAKIGEQSDKSTLFAFQVSPVGVEVGGRIAAYAEAGIGTSGSLWSERGTASDRKIEKKTYISGKSSFFNG